MIKFTPDTFAGIFNEVASFYVSFFVHAFPALLLGAVILFVFGMIYKLLTLGRF